MFRVHRLYYLRYNSSFAMLRTTDDGQAMPMSAVQDDLSRFFLEAGKQEIIITHHDKPAGVLIDFETEDDSLECRPENDPRLLRGIARAWKHSCRARRSPGGRAANWLVGSQRVRSIGT
jgi:hypothetical protein